MPKTSTNSAPCNCCGRLIPKKLGKAAYCSFRCRNVDHKERKHPLRQIPRNHHRGS